MSSVPNSGTYMQVWRALAANTREKVVVDCPIGHMETLIQAVKKVKSTENAARKRLGVSHWGRLVVHKDLKAKKVTFSLSYAMEDLI